VDWHGIRVDFLIARNDQPWLMVEVKSSINEPISPTLNYFQKQLQAPYALDKDQVQESASAHSGPGIIIPNAW